jgi:hypothetical protein
MVDGEMVDGSRTGQKVPNWARFNMGLRTGSDVKRTGFGYLVDICWLSNGLLERYLVDIWWM